MATTTSIVTPLPQLSVQNSMQTSLTGFIQSLSEPLVCLKFGAAWCNPCKQIAPLFESLAQQAAGSIRCFTVDVETPQGEQLGVANNVSSLPTFVFYTTQLSPNQELQIVETVVGSQADALKVNFSKGVQIAQAFLAQKHAAPGAVPPGPPAAPQAQQASIQAPPVQQPAHQVQGSHGHGATGGNDAVKRELLEIRAALIAGLQRIEKLYQSL